MKEIIVGAALGVIIGLVSGTVALVLLKTLNTSLPKDVKSVVELTTQMLAIPTFMLGGSWASGRLFKNLQLEKSIPYYIVSLAVTFSVTIGYPLFRWILHLGAELGRTNEGTRG